MRSSVGCRGHIITGIIIPLWFGSPQYTLKIQRRISVENPFARGFSGLKLSSKESYKKQNGVITRSLLDECELIKCPCLWQVKDNKMLSDFPDGPSCHHRYRQFHDWNLMRLRLPCHL